MNKLVSILLSSVISALVVIIFLISLHAFYGLEATTNLIDHCKALGYVGGEIDECVYKLQNRDK